VTLVVPGVIVALGEEVEVGWPAVPGAVLIAAGLALWAWTVTLFARIGKGTLAPWDPTQRLVVHGPYRHVRNPMISGVIAILLGEAALLGSWTLLAWALAFFALNATYIPLVEEPGLVRRFGDDYLRYRENVPRWLPRPRPWEPRR
jgi:protein-S-isoprenylcysteine O-methyltransferase Ste14